MWSTVPFLGIVFLINNSFVFGITTGPNAGFGQNNNLEDIFKDVVRKMKNAQRNPFRYGKRSETSAGEENFDQITYEIARAALNPRKYAPLSKEMLIEIRHLRRQLLAAFPALLMKPVQFSFLIYYIIEQRNQLAINNFSFYNPLINVQPKPVIKDLAKMLVIQDIGKSSFIPEKARQHYRRTNFIRARPGKRSSNVLKSQLRTPEKSSFGNSLG